MAEGIDINAEYTVMLDPCGQVIQNPEGQYLVLSAVNNQPFFRDLVFLDDAENLSVAAEDTKGIPEEVHSDDSTKAASAAHKPAPVRRGPWSDEQTLNLINYYKIKKELFDGTVVRNDMLWGKFVKDHSEEKGAHDLQQVKDKWTSLKRQFHKSMDNRSAKATGARRLEWLFFDAMYEILKDNPQSKPVAIASSRGGASNIVLDPDKIDSNDPEYNTRLRTSKKTKLQVHLETLGVERQKREEGVQERHADTMRMQGKALKVLGDISNSLKNLCNPGYKRKRNSDDKSDSSNDSD